MRQPRRTLSLHLPPAAILGLLVASLHAGAIDFNRDIRPILADNCYTCHGPDENHRKAGLRLDVKESAFGILEEGRRAVVPGDTARSELIRRITAADEDELMPPANTGRKLKPQQIDLLTRWVKDGATWTGHWAFIRPVRPNLPDVQSKSWVRNPIDRFILARLEAEKLACSPEADRFTLLRRVTFDLTGLPPTLAEIEAFVNDSSPEAYERVVDRLLASAAYGERMAQDWLDAARYADTNGYHIDNHRDIWKWREWVIDAFNRNMPFDQFTVEQLAGDLLPNATVSQKVATGFNRNEMVNFEGGAIEEEYATKYVVGRVNTTSTVFLGLTMQCAECHDHKYDPLTQREFYQLYAFFNNVPEKGLDGQRISPAPRLKLPTEEQTARMRSYEQRVVALEQSRRAIEADLPARQARWESQFRQSSAPAEPGGLVALYELDQCSGTIVDSSPEKRHAVFRGAEWPTVVPGKLSSGIRLDGRGSHVDCGDAADFERTQPFSYGCWVDRDGRDGAMIAKMAPGPTLRGFDVMTINGQVLVHLLHHWPRNAIKVQTTARVLDKNWHHVFVTYDGSSKAAGVKVYIDGRPVETEITNDTLTGTIRTDAPLRIGRRSDGFFMAGTLDDARVYARALSAAEVAAIAGLPARRLLDISPQHRTAQEKEQIARHYREAEDPDYRKTVEELAGVRREMEQLDERIVHTMVMEELPTPRETRILVRGDYRHKGDVVQPGVPAVLPPLPGGMKPDRLALARWLVADNHPLTARVTVNRFWQHYFGTGLTKTVDDFGTRGEWPSHPELLDWLATEFIGSGWNIKHIQRLIVTSAAYRQSSRLTPQLLSRDPDNRLLARGPRLRLTAEEIRDNALAISGLLNREMGGMSVFPYQPPGLWEQGAFGGGYSAQTYVQSRGRDLYRRGIYTYWKRSMPYPSFTVFDAPNREVCTVNRPRTNTPLQALVLLNDPVYVEAARALAQRVMIEAPSEPAQRIAYAFRLCTARTPGEAELAVLLRLYRQQLANYQADRAAAMKLVSTGESPRPEQLDVSELAAWTAVANVLLNLDETITK